MKLLTNGEHHVHPRIQDQVLQHVGPAGLRHYAQEVGNYEVPGARNSTGDCIWETSFVAGDLISVLAGTPQGGPVEIALFGQDGRPLVLSSCPGGFCHAGVKIPHSGVYTLRVRFILLARLMGDMLDDASASTEQPAPFELCCTRQVPRRLPARLAPPRRRARPRFAKGVFQRVLVHLSERKTSLTVA